MEKRGTREKGGVGTCSLEGWRRTLRWWLFTIDSKLLFSRLVTEKRQTNSLSIHRVVVGAYKKKKKKKNAIADVTKCNRRPFTACALGGCSMAFSRKLPIHAKYQIVRIFWRSAFRTFRLFGHSTKQRPSSLYRESFLFPLCRDKNRNIEKRKKKKMKMKKKKGRSRFQPNANLIRFDLR